MLNTGILCMVIAAVFALIVYKCTDDDIPVWSGIVVIILMLPTFIAVIGWCAYMILSVLKNIWGPFI